MPDDIAESSGIEEVEVVTTAVGDDGTVVVDDLKALVDEDGNVLATDETIAVEAPDGTIVIDEVIAVADDDGELEVDRGRRRRDRRGRSDERLAHSGLRTPWGQAACSFFSASRARSAWTFMRISLLITSTTRRSWPITNVTRLAVFFRATPIMRGDVAVGVGEQRVVEPVLLRELLLLVDRVEADADALAARRRRTRPPGHGSGSSPSCTRASSPPGRRTAPRARWPAGRSACAACRSRRAARSRRPRPLRPCENAT